MQSLHPRYPVLKVPAPARLSAAVAQGLMMPETGAPGGGNIDLHIWHTYGGGRGALLSSFPLIYKRSCHQKRGACLLHRSIRRDLRDLAFIYICTGSYGGVPNGRLSLDTAVLAFHDGGAGFEHLIAKLNRPRLGVYAHNGLGTAGTQQ